MCVADTSTVRHSIPIQKTKLTSPQLPTFRGDVYLMTSIVAFSLTHRHPCSSPRMWHNQVAASMLGPAVPPAHVNPPPSGCWTARQKLSASVN